MTPTNRAVVSLPQAGTVARSSVYPRILVAFFLLSLPLVNPVVHGDGVGYYAYARAPLIQHNLRFEEDWRHGNLNFAQSRTLSNGQLEPNQYAQSGYVNNLFTVGPAILWSPFLLAAHAAVLTLNGLGARIPADGFSAPYRVAMALGTAIYGFLGLSFSFALARKFVQEKWAFLATLGIWTASALPVYMYFNPAWSHAHSAFVVALFFWYWERTRPERRPAQWLVLGLLSGLMIDVYFPNGVFLLIPLVEAVRSYSRLLLPQNRASLLRHLVVHGLFLVTVSIAVVPTLITRRIIFGGMLRFGSYTALGWDWRAPFWRRVAFSADHGLLSWTPILIFALVGLFLAQKTSRAVAAYLTVGAAGFYYLISSYPYWDGLSSFGNRFFISLTPMFIFGLALLLERVDSVLSFPRYLFPAAAALIALFAMWNGGFIYQWGAHLISPRGAVSFREVARNQVFVVPRQLDVQLRAYFFRRSELMQEIERRDIEQLKKATPSR